MTIQDFITKHLITMTVIPDVRPNQIPDDFRGSHAWTCTLHFKRRRMTVPFFMGSGDGGKEPKLSEVLYCLQADASCVMCCTSFEDWCAELGYDTDSRKAEKIYRACENQTIKLRRFLGDAFLFEEFMACEE